MDCRVQLAWRNYRVPVDAGIETIADIQKQGVEVNRSRILAGVGPDARRATPADGTRDVDRDRPRVTSSQL
jgi:hypothetical protein